MKSIRKRIFDILQPAEDGDVCSRVFDILVSALVVGSVVCVFAVTFDLPDGLVRWMGRFEVFASIVFSIEYLLRILTADFLYPKCGKAQAVGRYVVSGMAIVDLLSILPLYLPLLFPGSLLAIRIFRLLRLLRIFKLKRYSESLAAIGLVVRAKSRELVGSLMLVMMLLVVASLVIYTVEHDAQPEAFKNAFTGLWWAVATLTTVGYGDIYPVTVTGRIFGAVIALLGVGMVAIPTGIISSGLVDHMNQHRDRRAFGEQECELSEDYVLVVGYTFQAKALVRRLLGTPGIRILLMTSRDVPGIHADLVTEFSRQEMNRLAIIRRDPSLASSYSALRIRGARQIYILGDEGVAGRDGIVLRASEMIAAKAASEDRMEGDVPVKAFLQFEDPGIYAQLRSHELPMDGADAAGNVLFDLEVFNYYDSWVWKCWSEKDSQDGADPYLPLRFKPDAERVELFVIGSGKAVKAIADSAITLMNYGDDARQCRLTVVSDCAHEVLPPEDAVAALPELVVAERPLRDLGRKVAAEMVAAASDEKCAVTVVIAEDAPEKAVKTYMGLPFALRNKDVSVLLWMGAQSRNLPAKQLVKVGGDCTRLRYFGMSDCQPWLEIDRSAIGADVNFYYSVHEQLPKGVDRALAGTARKLWDEKKALGEWKACRRWKKWASINSCGTFKEKAALIAGRELTADLQLRLLKAEHNRWWTEHLLGDWRLGERDESRRLHPNLVPFEDLDDFTKDIDKICIAAMARQGFIA